MNKKEVTEIKKLFTKERCCLNRLCGCYVDADKNKVVQFKEAFLSLPEEEAFKYFTIFRNGLSGTIGKKSDQYGISPSHRRRGRYPEFPFKASGQ